MVLGRLSKVFSMTKKSARKRMRRLRIRKLLWLELLEKRDVFSATLIGGIWGADEGALDVAADLKFSFSEAVRAGESGYVHVYQGNGALVESLATQANSRVTFSGTTVVVNPNWDFDGSLNYFLRIDAGAIETLDGEAFGGVSDSSTLRWATGFETQNAYGSSYLRDVFPGTSSESIGDHRVLYIRATYQDIHRTPNMLSEAEDDMVLTSQAYVENSRGRMPVTVTYTPVVTLPFTRAWLDTFDSSINGLGLIQSAARGEARKLGFDDASYNVGIVRVDGGLRSGSSWGGAIAFG